MSKGVNICIKKVLKGEKCNDIRKSILIMFFESLYVF